MRTDSGLAEGTRGRQPLRPDAVQGHRLRPRPARPRCAGCGPRWPRRSRSGVQTNAGFLRAAAGPPGGRRRRAGHRPGRAGGRGAGRRTGVPDGGPTRRRRCCGRPRWSRRRPRLDRPVLGAERLAPGRRAGLDRAPPAGAGPRAGDRPGPRQAEVRVGDGRPRGRPERPTPPVRRHRSRRSTASRTPSTRGRATGSAGTATAGTCATTTRSPRPSRGPAHAGADPHRARCPARSPW